MTDPNPSTSNDDRAALSFEPRIINPADLAAAQLARQDSTHSYLELDTTAQLPYADLDDFERRALKHVDRPAFIHSPTGRNGVEIITSVEYTQVLDRVRAHLVDGSTLSDSDEPYKERLSPEHLFLLLNELPDRRLFSRVLLLRDGNPRDAWLQQLYKNLQFSSAMEISRTEKGLLRLFASSFSEFTRTNLCHEWCHRLEHTLSDEEWQLFSDAVALEWAFYIPRNYMLTSYEEHWAVLGEELLHADADKFLQAASKGPLRTVGFMRPFERHLNSVPVSLRSPYHDKFLARCEYTRLNVVPKARERLAKATSLAARI